MEIHQLRYFRAVAQLRSFTKAAKREHVSQPSLSHQIMKLEDELGAKLFNRKGHLVGLTAYGEAFLPKVDSVLQQLQDAQTQIFEMVHAGKGKVILGVIPTVAPFLLPDVLPAFLKQHPSVEVEVKEETSGVLLQALQEKAIDLAIMPIPTDSDELTSVELIREKLFTIVGEDHPLQSEEYLTLQQLSGSPFLILKDGHCFRDDTLAAFHKAQVEPRIMFESGCFLTILNMVRAGMGVSVMPQMAINEGAGCKFIPIRAEQPIRTIALVQSKKSPQTHAQRLLAAYLKTRIQPSEGKKGNLAADG